MLVLVSVTCPGFFRTTIKVLCSQPCLPKGQNGAIFPSWTRSISTSDLNPAWHLTADINLTSCLHDIMRSEVIRGQFGEIFTTWRISPVMRPQSRRKRSSAVHITGTSWKSLKITWFSHATEEHREMEKDHNSDITVIKSNVESLTEWKCMWEMDVTGSGRSPLGWVMSSWQRKAPELPSHSYPSATTGMSGKLPRDYPLGVKGASSKLWCYLLTFTFPFKRIGT